MTHHKQINLKAPYLIFIGDVESEFLAKTGFGLLQWRPELVIGQLRLPKCAIDLGVSELSIQDAVLSGVKSLIIGVAPVGGSIPESWWDVINEAAEFGLDIVSGLHTKLAENTTLSTIAKLSGSNLIDIRNPPSHIGVGTGIKRKGKRMLMVGTDCAVGKKYSALAMERSMIKAGINSTFRATGQTGIMLAGKGIPIDAVIADFVSGAAELISPDNEKDHWDIIEGQGSLFHPGYASVSLGLLHGSQPDAIVVCHDANRKHIAGWQDYALPTIAECICRNIIEGQLTNPEIQCIGVCVNTSKLSATERESYLKNLEDELLIPCVDPLINSCNKIVQHLEVIM